MKKKIFVGLSSILLLTIAVPYQEVAAANTVRQNSVVAVKSEGNYISDGSYVQVTKKNYDMWQNFSWKKKNNTSSFYGKILKARGRYEHKNGATYYSLYDNKGKWYGYLNAKATKKVGAQGSYISDGSYVQLTKNNYGMWQNFNWKKKGTTTDVYGKTLKAKGRYEHFNGSTYLSLYDSKDKWYGYLNVEATKKISPQGNYITDGRKVEITSKNYDLWQNFSWKKRGSSNVYYGQVFEARGRYEHFNGLTYYSLYNDKGEWLGYINAKATKVSQEITEERHVTVKVDTAGKKLSSTNGYTLIGKSKPVLTVIKENGKKIKTYTTTETYKKDNNKDINKTINKDESGKVLTGSLTGYTLVNKGKAVKTVEKLSNGDTVTIYTTTNIYHKNINKDINKTINKDELGNIIKVSLAEYELIQKGNPIKTVEKLSNGDTLTTYTTTNIYQKVDPIIKKIVKSTDSRVKNIEKQITKDDTGVSIRQAQELSSMELNNKVARIFTDMVNEERRKYNDPMISVTQDEKAKKEIASRAVEVMYYFEHSRPSQMLVGEVYHLDRLPGEKEMAFSTENISQNWARKSEANRDPNNLAREVAEGMFSQYIDGERDSARSDAPYSGDNGHYRNIIMTKHSDIVVAVYLVDNGGGYGYSVSTTVSTGDSYMTY